MMHLPCFPLLGSDLVSGPEKFILGCFSVIAADGGLHGNDEAIGFLLGFCSSDSPGQNLD